MLDIGCDICTFIVLRYYYYICLLCNAWLHYLTVDISGSVGIKAVYRGSQDSV